MKQILREGDPEIVFGQPISDEPHPNLTEDELIDTLTKEVPSFPVENLDFHGSGAGDLGAYLDHLLELKEAREEAQAFETDFHAVSEDAYIKWGGNFEVFNSEKADQGKKRTKHHLPHSQEFASQHGQLWKDSLTQMFDPPANNSESSDIKSHMTYDSFDFTQVDDNSPLCTVSSLLSFDPKFLARTTNFGPMIPTAIRHKKSCREKAIKACKRVINRREQSESEQLDNEADQIDQEKAEIPESQPIKEPVEPEFMEVTQEDQIDPAEESVRRHDEVNPHLTGRYDPDNTVSTTYLGHVHGDTSPMFSQHSIRLDRHLKTEAITFGKFKARTLFDTGATVSLVSQTYLNRIKKWSEAFRIPNQKISVGDGATYVVKQAIKVPVRLQNHNFEMVAWIIPMSEDMDLVFGMQSMVEIEGIVDTRDAEFKFRSRLTTVRAPFDVSLRRGTSTRLALTTDGLPPEFQEGKAVCKLKLPGQEISDTIITDIYKQKVLVKIQNSSRRDIFIPQGQPLGIIDLRSVGYFYSSLEGQAQFLSPQFFFMGADPNGEEAAPDKGIRPPKPKPKGKKIASSPDYNKNEQTVLRTTGPPPTEQGTKVYKNGYWVEKDDPYPWLPPDDPRRHQTDMEIIQETINLQDCCEEVDESMKESIRNLCHKYAPAFSLRDEIGTCESLEVDLNLKDEDPFNYRPHNMNERDKDVIDKEMKRGCLLGILKKGLSPYSSPIMLIPRKQGGPPRIVTDFRFLNSRLKPLQCSLPLMREAIQSLGASEAQVASIIDLRDAFHTLKITLRSQKFTGITPYFGSSTYMYQRMPMGLSVSPAIFMSFITGVMNELEHRKDFIAIVDDILVHSKFDSHLERLEELFQALIKNGLKISPKKAQFFRKKIIYMGLEISYEHGRPTITPTKSRTEAIRKITRLESVQDVRSYCGMVNFLCMFIPAVQAILDPIYKLMRKNTEFVWTEQCQNALDKIREILSNPPVLTLPNLTGRFTLVSDTSKVATGAALYQEQDGELRLIAYHSKRLNDAAQRYSISELELHGLYINIKAFDHYLRGVEFDAIVDHSALVYILTTAREPPTLRLKKLVEKLMQYQVKTKFLRGQEMYVSDFLSRHIEDEEYSKEVLPVSLFNRVECYSGKELLILTENQLASIQKRSKDRFNAQTRLQSKLQTGGDETEDSKLKNLKPQVRLEKLSQKQIDELTNPKQDKDQQNEIKKRFIETMYAGELPAHDETSDFRKPEDVLFRENRPLFQSPIKLEDVLYKHLPRQAELTKHLEQLGLKTLHNYDLPLSAKELSQEQQRDPYFSEIYKYISGTLHLKGKYASQITEALKRESEDYVIINTLLFHVVYLKNKGIAFQLCIPQQFMPTLLYSYHDNLMAAHAGVIRMYQTIREKYFAPYLLDNIRKYVQCCHTCEVTKENDKESTASYLRIPYDFRPMRNFSMDIKEMPESPEGFKYVLYCVCDFSNYVVGIPLKNISAKTIVSALVRHVFFVFGPPDRIVTDQAKQFTSTLMKQVCQTLGINLKIVSPGNHGSLRVERYIQTLSNMIKKTMHAHRREDWQKLVASCCYAHNTLKTETLQGYCPYELVFLHEPKPLLDFNLPPIVEGSFEVKQYMNQLKATFQQTKEVILKEKLKNQMELKAREKRLGLRYHVYAHGDLVYYYAPRLTDLQPDSRKFTAHWIGPLVVKQILDKTHVLLQDLKGKELKFLGGVHVNLLKPCFQSKGFHNNRLVTFSDLIDREGKLTKFAGFLL